MNLLLVENPAIYMNCREAMVVLGLKAADTTIIVTSIFRKNLEQLKTNINVSEWKDVHFPTIDSRAEKFIAEGKVRTVAPSGLSTLLFIRANLARVTSIAEQFPVIHAVVCGVYGNELSLHVCSAIKYSQYVLVDDGNMTMFTARGRAAERAANFSGVLGVNSISDYRGFLGKLKLFVKRRVIGVKDRGVEAITFFTAHHDIAVCYPDSVIRNQYSAFMARIDDPVMQANRVYILGAPVLERNILRESDYKKLLRFVAARYSGKDITYFPHRMETDASLGYVREALGGAKIIRPDVPFEHYIGSARELPAAIASFYSSAVTNLLVMRLPSVKIHVIKFPWQRVVEARKAELVKTVYEDLCSRRDDSLEIVEVDL